VPYQNAGQLQNLSILVNGSPQLRPANPVTDFTVTLSDIDTNAYQATRSVLSAYQSAGGPIGYSVVPLNNRVDVIPTQVLAAGGTLTNIATPVMSQPVTFAPAARSIADALQLVVDAVSTESGFKVVLADVPGSPLETVQLGAAALPARDVIAAIGLAINRQVSFQCLYDAGSKTYYLNVRAVAPDPIPGGPAQHGNIRPLPSVGPATSPFSIKK
jgi:hypothetical protein